MAGAKEGDREQSKREQEPKRKTQEAPDFFSWIAKRFPRDGSEITNKAPIRRARRREQELIFGRKSVVPSGEHREAPFYGGTLSGFMLRKLFKQTRHEAREGPCLRHLAGRGGGGRRRKVAAARHATDGQEGGADKRADAVTLNGNEGWAGEEGYW